MTFNEVALAEANSNFGFNLPWWDRLFGTYRAAAALPQERMVIGVHGLTGDPRCVHLSGMLVLPFRELDQAVDAPAHS